MANTKGRREHFGNVRKLPSGRYQARWNRGGKTHSARTDDGYPLTFSTEAKARAWLRSHAEPIKTGAWPPPPPPTVVRFGDFADQWLTGRDLKPRTRDHYRQLLRDHIVPTFGATALGEITPATVRAWHAELSKSTGPTSRAHAYGLLRTILGTAVADGHLPANPCHIRGAGSAKRVHRIEPLTVNQLGRLADEMPDDRYRLMTLLAGWCGLRFGELAELRRKDVDLALGVLHVRRAVVRVQGEPGPVVDTPKSAAGVRDVAVPPHLLPELRSYLGKQINGGRDGLLFPASDGMSHLVPSTLYRVFYPARERAGLPNLRWHDLRHCGAVLAAQTGATLAELMARLGHSTSSAALRYQHAAQGRDAAIAAALSVLAEAGATTEAGQ